MSIGGWILRTVAPTLMRQARKPAGFLGHLEGLLFASRRSNRLRNRWTVDLLDLQPGDKVLEIGFGPGVAIRLAASRLREGSITGVDHSRVMYEHASIRNAALIREGRVHLHCGGLEVLPQLSTEFDKAFAVNVLGFLGDVPDALRSIRKVLRPNGLLAVTHMPRHLGASPHDADDYARSLARDMVSAGFHAVTIEKLDLKPMPAVCILGHSREASLS